MNEFKLIGMRIRHFKAIDDLEVIFHPQETVIKGKNGSGKTSVFDAFTWCLFGKDHEDRTDKGRGSFSIKKTINGKPQLHFDHEVVLMVSINGHEMTLGRRLSETWRTRNGEQEFAGDKTTCMWDGIEIGVNEYNKRIESEFIGQSQFKMLTNPMYFSSLPWKDQLDFLTQAFAKEITIEHVAATREDWQEEINHLSPKVTIADVKTQISTERRRIGDRLKEIPSIVKGIREATPAAEDWEDLLQKKSRLEEEMGVLDASMKGTADGERVKFERVKALQQQVNDKRRQILEAVRSENAKRIEEASKENEQFNELKKKLDNLERCKDSILGQREDVKTATQDTEMRHAKRIRELKEKEEKLLKQWEEVSAEEWKPQGDALVCPLCKEPCDSAKMVAKFKESGEEALKNFNANKAKRLDEIDKLGCENAKEIDSEEEDFKTQCERSKGYLEMNYKSYEKTCNDIKEVKVALAGFKQAVAEQVTEKDIAVCVQLQGEIDQLERDIERMQGSATNTSEQIEQKNKLKNEISELDSLLGIQKVISSNEQKIVKLEEEAESLAKQKDTLDRRVNSIEELQRAFIDATEDIINEHFSYVRFKTQEAQVNGEVVETCYPTLYGVKFGDLNDAGKIYAGLDIISTLNKVYEMKAPIFMDRAESVTSQSYEYDGQIVKLKADFCDLEVEHK